MASLVAKAIRNQEARDSLDAVLQRLVDRLNIDVPPAPTGRIADPDLIPIMQMERFRDTLLEIETSLDVAATNGGSAKPRSNNRRANAKSNDA